MMSEKLIARNIAAVVASQTLPGITIWNRLEGRPRAEKFDRALRAEVRDALWMLTRQWQMGEFRGDDAGSPIFAKVRVETTRLRKYQAANGDVEKFDDAIPLEARVEQMPVPLVLANHEVSLDIRLLAGRHWLKLVTPLAPTAAPDFISNYSIHVPNPSQIADAPTLAHPEAWSNFAAATAASRRMDGVKLYRHLKDGGAVTD
jgi:hypothetical protein